jgi:hypothetical protein
MSDTEPDDDAIKSMQMLIDSWRREMDQDVLYATLVEVIQQLADRLDDLEAGVDG